MIKIGNGEGDYLTFRQRVNLITDVVLAIFISQIIYNGVGLIALRIWS